MDKSKEKEKLMDLIVDAKRADPETGGFTEWLPRRRSEGPVQWAGL